MLEEPEAHKQTTTSSEIEAEFFWTAANRAPEVVLAFNGLHEPTELFAELHAIGWTVPPCPPRPGSAIEWTPDPTTGADYTIRPWRVAEFKLRPSSWWTPESEAEIGAKTVAALQRHHAQMTGLPSSAVEPQTEPLAPAPAPAAVNTAAEATPTATDQPQVIVVDPSGQLPDGFTLWGAESGRQRAVWAWGESAHDAATLFADSAQLAEFYARGGRAWTFESRSRPVPTSDATTAVQMIALDTAPDDKKIVKLASLLGDQAALLPLTALTGGSNAVLMCAIVPTQTVEMLVSNLRLRNPKGILRTATGG